MKTATCSITTLRPRTYFSGRKKPTPTGCIVTVESVATRSATDWFGKHNIRDLDFKCKTWSKVSGASSKLTIKSLREIFGEDCKIKFSMYAGCSMCPCSPGYKVTELKGENVEKYGNHWVYVDVKEDVTAFEAKLPSYVEKLKIELEEHQG